MSLLPDGTDDSTTSLLFMTLIYGYILLKAAEQIGEGSEMLLTVFGPGIVGGLVIPILGAIPDGMIILCSGLSGGTEEEMLYSLQIGLGTLAGSTVSLLTLPWAGAILLGWRDLDPNTGEAMYKEVDGIKVPKADEGFSLFYSGVTVTKSTAQSVYVMLGTSLCYLIIQIPAAVWSSLSEDKQEAYEHVPALIGLIVALLALVGYCVYQLRSATAEENLQRKSEEAKIKRWQHHFGKTIGKFDNVVTETFCRIDIDNNGTLDPNELERGLKLLGLPVVNKELFARVVATMDVDGDGKISLSEFRKAVKLWIHPYGRKNTQILSNSRRHSVAGRHSSVAVSIASSLLGAPQGTGEFTRPRGSGESEAHEYMAKSLNPEYVLLGQHGQDRVKWNQISPEGKPPRTSRDPYHDEVEKCKPLQEPEPYLLLKACFHLSVGMALVLLFSDPMVSILSKLASKIGVGAFYVSFVVTPLSSNASEMVSALYFARSKTEAKVSMALSSLYGAACMNNTFCLAVFFLIIYMNELPWQFSAETMCILLCEIAMAVLGYKTTIPVWKAMVALLLYPLALIFVIVWTMLE